MKMCLQKRVELIPVMRRVNHRKRGCESDGIHL
jgi:hypothetical protein